MSFKEKIRITLRGYRYLFSLEKTYVILLVITTAFSAVMPYIPIFFSARIVNELCGERSVDKLLLYVVLTIGLSFLLNMVNTLLQKNKGYREKFFYNNESLAFSEKAMRMDYGDLESRETTLLYERIKVEKQTGFNVGQLRYTMTNFVSCGVRIVCSVSLTASLFFNSFINGPGKLLLLLLIAGVSVLTSLLADYRMRQLDSLFSKAPKSNALANFYSDYLSNYNAGKEIRMYGMQRTVVNAQMESANEICRLNVTVNCRQAVGDLIGEGASYLLQLVLYVLLVSAAASGGVSVGSIAQYVSCTLLFMSALQEIIGALRMADANCEYLKTYFSYFDIPSKMYQGSLPVEKRYLCDEGDNEYEIEFRDVSFRYPASDAYALRHVSMKFRVGERLAIVGMNGSGKTTFIKLLCRLYDPTEGEILLNGVDIRKYDYRDYMSIFSVVFQDFKLFSFPLGQNVAASGDYDPEKAEFCLTKAGFGDRLNRLTDGLQSCLYKDFDENGVEISGGEAQKIALARALYRGAPFIVLDEPTAALDPVAEFEIYSKFNEIVGNKTAIYISHRLSSCRFCDKIAVFHESRLIESGSHDMLVADKSSKYYELWNAQAQYYAQENG